MTENPLRALLPPTKRASAELLWRRVTARRTYRQLGTEFGVSAERARMLTTRGVHWLRVWYAGNPRLRPAREPLLRALLRPYPELYGAVFGEAP